MNTPRIIIIAAAYHQPLTDYMISAATDEIQQQKAVLTNTIKVPGSFEIPLSPFNKFRWDFVIPERRMIVHPGPTVHKLHII